MSALSREDRNDVELCGLLARPVLWSGQPPPPTWGLTAIVFMTALRSIAAHVPLDDGVIAAIFRLQVVETRAVVSSLNFWFPFGYGQDARSALRMVLRMRIPTASNTIDTRASAGRLIRSMSEEIFI